MKTSNEFKNVIQNYLVQRAKEDFLFAETLEKPDKNIDDCVNYILAQVQKSGINGFADSEIFAMAVHYYDESNIEVGAKINAKIVINHSIDISEQDIASAKERALNEIIANEKQKILNKTAKKKSEPTKVEQIDLFG